MDRIDDRDHTIVLETFVIRASAPALKTSALAVLALIRSWASPRTGSTAGWLLLVPCLALTALLALLPGLASPRWVGDYGD